MSEKVEYQVTYWDFKKDKRVYQTFSELVDAKRFAKSKVKLPEVHTIKLLEIKTITTTL